MKIGLDGRLIYETGVGRYIRSLLKYLPRLNPEHEWVLFAGCEIEKGLVSGWKVVRANVAWHTLREQILMPEIFKSQKLDLVHIPYFSVPVFMSTPYVVTIHDLTINHFATGKATTLPYILYKAKRLGYQLVMKNAIAKSKAVITVSKTVKKEIINAYHVPEGKIQVTLESGELEETANKLTHKDFTKPYILYVGNAHPHKNLETLVDAFVDISSDIPDLQLVLIGKNDFFYRKLKKYVENKMSSTRIQFMDAVPNSGLANWYTNARAFIFPSFSEGFGIPGLEAMSKDCPVIASDIPVFHEIYGDAALFFDPKSSSSLTVQLKRVLLNGNLRENLIQKGAFQAGLYSWEKMSERTLSIYESCLGLRSCQ